MDLSKTSVVCDQGIKTLQNLVATLGEDVSTEKLKQLLQPVKLFDKLRDIQALARAMELELRATLDGQISIDGSSTASSTSTSSSSSPIIKL